MGKAVRVFLFSDALGWEIVNRYHFMESELAFRYPVRTQFGYSSTAVPTILSGEPPTEHGHFSFFFLDRNGRSPFKVFRYCHFLLHPAWFFNNHRIRRRIGNFLKLIFGFTGYFNLYKVPYSRLALFDYCEKNDIFAPGGLGRVANLHDMLEKTGLKYNISDWRRGDEYNLDEAERLLNSGETEFMFVYTAGLDGMLHFHVGDPDFVAVELDRFAGRVRALMKAAAANYEDWALTVISDHGMTPLAGAVDLRSRVEALGLKFGRDYAASYDSTMLRVWILKPECRRALMDSMNGAPGHWLTAREKSDFQVDFPDGKYGDEIFLLDAGIQLVPGDMGDKPIPGMHGYSPLDKDSEASLLASSPPPMIPSGIAGFFTLMKLTAAELVEHK
ncbi:MAG: alkaline phosphatase family protein [Victivallaceae bacterium]|nr:alkaline phosphatase family protein [Victivallaceae bacterium]